jgi:hypothetical protein
MSKHRLWDDVVPEWTIPAHGVMRPVRSDRTWAQRPQRGPGRHRRAGLVRRAAAHVAVTVALSLVVFGVVR